MVQVLVLRSTTDDRWTAALTIEGVHVVAVTADSPEAARAALVEHLRARLG